MNAADGGDQSVKIKSLEAAKIMRIEVFSQLLSARSWLYRSRVLQVNTKYSFESLCQDLLCLHASPGRTEPKLKMRSNEVIPLHLFDLEELASIR